MALEGGGRQICYIVLHFSVGPEEARRATTADVLRSAKTRRAGTSLRGMGLGRKTLSPGRETTMPKPWEMTIEDAQREGEALRGRLREADGDDAMFFSSVMEASATEAEEVSRDPPHTGLTTRRAEHGSD